MTTNVKFAKVRPDAKIPSKRDEDMGFDIYACFDEDYMVINPHETKLIPTGIASSCDSDYGFVLRERGSTGSKGIALRAGVIDSGYRNEWFVGLTNTGRNTVCITKLPREELMTKYTEMMTNLERFASEFAKKCYEVMMWRNASEFVLYPYEKAIAQALVVPVPKVNVEEISYDALQNIESERGLGALGSSGK